MASLITKTIQTAKIVKKICYVQIDYAKLIKDLSSSSAVTAAATPSVASISAPLHGLNCSGCHDASTTATRVSSRVNKLRTSSHPLFPGTTLIEN